MGLGGSGGNASIILSKVHNPLSTSASSLVDTLAIQCAVRSATTVGCEKKGPTFPFAAMILRRSVN